MESIVLRPNLRKTLEEQAQQAAKTVNELVNEAVEQYLLAQQRPKLDREIAAYERLHPELRQTHLGQWVAIHQQQLVDADTDQAALYRRIRAKYGRTSVLIRQVTEQAIEEVWLRTPSTGKVG
jgi:hypothetical protein